MIQTPFAASAKPSRSLILDIYMFRYAQKCLFNVVVKNLTRQWLVERHYDQSINISSCHYFLFIS
jgi:hypothetical protein